MPIYTHVPLERNLNLTDFLTLGLVINHLNAFCPKKCLAQGLNNDGRTENSPFTSLPFQGLNLGLTQTQLTGTQMTTL